MLWLSPNARVAVGAGGAVLGACSSRVSEYVVGAYPLRMVSSNTVPLLLRGCVWGSVPHETGWPLGHMAVELYPGAPGGYEAVRRGAAPFPCLAESQNTVEHGILRVSTSL